MKSPHEDRREYFTPEEAAEYIRMSVTYLMESDCARVRLGRSVRFRRATLDAFMVAREHGAGVAA